MHRQFRAAQRAAQVVFQNQALARGRVHGFGKELVGVPAMTFCLIHGGVGMLDEIDDVGSIPGIQGHPDAGRDLDFLAFDHHGSRQGVSDLFDDDRRGLGGRLPVARGVRHQDDELIAPPAGSAVAFAQAPGKTRGDFAQQPIPGRMPQRIVDRLKAIEVQNNIATASLARWARASAIRSRSSNSARLGSPVSPS